MDHRILLSNRTRVSTLTSADLLTDPFLPKWVCSFSNHDRQLTILNQEEMSRREWGPQLGRRIVVPPEFHPKILFSPLLTYPTVPNQRLPRVTMKVVEDNQFCSVHRLNLSSPTSLSTMENYPPHRCRVTFHITDPPSLYTKYPLVIIRVDGGLHSFTLIPIFPKPSEHHFLIKMSFSSNRKRESMTLH